MRREVCLDEMPEVLVILHRRAPSLTDEPGALLKGAVEPTRQRFLQLAPHLFLLEIVAPAEQSMQVRCRGAEAVGDQLQVRRRFERRLNHEALKVWCKGDDTLGLSLAVTMSFLRILRSLAPGVMPVAIGPSGVPCAVGMEGQEANGHVVSVLWGWPDRDLVRSRL